MYAANQPLSQPSARAAVGSTGSSRQPTSAIPSSGPIAGVTRAFAGSEYTGTLPNWSQRIGAVAAPQAVETAIASRSQFGSG